MKTTKTCLAFLLCLLASKAEAEMTSTLDQTSCKPATAALYSAVLPGNIIYWRAGSFTPMTQTVATEINATSKAKGLILDLRNNTTGNAAGADQIATALNGASMVVVLTNRETRGAAENLAATLQSRGALVMGEATKSKIVPDVTTTATGREESEALALIDRQQVNAVITETAARHRMSEAALVKGQDPEQDAFIASHEQAAPVAVATAHDVALVEALDSFKAIRVLQGEESSPQPRVADTTSTAGLTVIASSGLR